MSTFSVVSTPIGNLGDITFRAVETLRKAGLVLCEDTRVTGKLLAKYEIRVPTSSYHAHSKISRMDDIIDMLRAGKNISLVSDAGTPGISDPGSELVGKIRMELAREIESGEIKIEAVPGPSALSAAISIAGVPTSEFVFMGFLPHKKGRQTLLKEAMSSDRAVIFYESPHRIMKALEFMSGLSSLHPQRRLAVCRELTKVFEEVKSGQPREVLDYFTSRTDKIRGEFVVIVFTHRL